MAVLNVDVSVLRCLDDVKANEIDIPRNIELADAIRKYLKKYCDPGKNEIDKRHILEVIRGWAWEIVLNCDEELGKYQVTDVRGSARGSRRM